MAWRVAYKGICWEEVERTRVFNWLIDFEHIEAWVVLYQFERFWWI